MTTLPRFTTNTPPIGSFTHFLEWLYDNEDANTPILDPHGKSYRYYGSSIEAMFESSYFAQTGSFNIDDYSYCGVPFYKYILIEVDEWCGRFGYLAEMFDTIYTLADQKDPLATSTDRMPELYDVYLDSIELSPFIIIELWKQVADLLIDVTSYKLNKKELVDGLFQKVQTTKKYQYIDEYNLMICAYKQATMKQ
jgi:hypothetical protein